MAGYLKLVPPDEALKIFFNALPPLFPSAESVLSAKSCGRVTSEAVLSPEPLPAFSRSTVDGFAVKARDTFGASEANPAYLSVVGEVCMGEQPEFIICSGQSAMIHTGGMIPDGADAVVMLEYTQRVKANEFEFLRPVALEENILRVGEDVITGQQILAAGTKLRPADIGGLLALGLVEVKVAKRVRVGIISTGDEVVQPDINLKPGQIRDINSLSLAALIEQAGGIPVLYGIIPDDIIKIQKCLFQAHQENEIVVISAGSSASVRDLTSEAVRCLGSPGVLVHGINIKPGKPTLLAVCNGKPVLGLPGNPVSALVIAYLFIVPLLERMLGLSPERPKPIIQARLEANIPSQAGREDWVPVRLKKTGNETCAEPIFFKSNLIFALSRADGLVRVPAAANGLEAGSINDVFLF